MKNYCKITYYSSFLSETRQTDRQTYIQTDGHFYVFTYAITILSLFTYSVCDEKVKKQNKVKKKKFYYLQPFRHKGFKYQVQQSINRVNSLKPTSDAPVCSSVNTLFAYLYYILLSGCVYVCVK